MLKKLMLLLVISIQVLLTASCGGVSNDGTTSLFETASVSFVSTPVSSTSTVSAKPNTDDSASKATLTITILPYPNFTVSPFTVRNMKYTYTQTQGGNTIFTIADTNYGAGLSFNPVLASGNIMDQLIDLGFVPGSTSLTQSWIFNVQASYTVVEDNSGKTRNYSVPLGTVRFI